LYIIGPSKIDIFTIFQFKHVKTLVIDIQPGTAPGFPTTDTCVPFPQNHIKVNEKYMYYTLWTHNQVFVFEKNNYSTPYATIGVEDKSTKNGEFFQPTGLAMKPNILYICDTGNHRIQKIDAMNSLFLLQWGHEGTDDGEFHYPTSIYYHKDFVYIADYYSVQFFTSEGNFIQRIGGKTAGEKSEEFSNIRGLCVNKDQLYVSDGGNRRIQIFRQRI